MKSSTFQALQLPLNGGDRFGGPGGDRFEVEKAVARGAESIVYRVMDTRLERLVAVKVSVAAPGIVRQVQLQRFERELRLASRVEHAHVLKVHDCGELASGHPFLMLEWMPWGTLQTHIDRAAKTRRVLPMGYVLYYARSLAVAIRAAHAASIVHRDVKPANLLIDHRGVAKLGDFGVSLDERPHSIQLGDQTLAVGTNGYMPAEQLEGSAKPQSDVFAFGIVLYQLMTGRLPEQVEVGGQYLGAVHDKAWKRLPEPIARLLRKLTAARWQERPVDFHEVLGMVDHTEWAQDDRDEWTSHLPPLPQEVFQTGGTSKMGVRAKKPLTDW